MSGTQSMNLDRLMIQGGVPLQGNVPIRGAKNSALVLMAAAVLGTQDIIVLENVPRLADIEVMADVLRSLGADVQFTDSHTLQIDPREINKISAPYELVTRMRASFFVLGPLLARMGRAEVSLPGGCAIGSRPVDIHLKGLEAMGAHIEIEHGNVIAHAEKLVGADFHFNFPSVGATENLMMAACLAEGQTRLSNVAREPEIIDLANFLIQMGAQIEGAGSDVITIQGVKSLKQPVYYSVMPDRIEAGTFMIAAAMTKGDVTLNRAPVAALDSLISKLREANVDIEIIDEHTLRVRGRNPIIATSVRTMPHPGFPTDMQAQFAALMSIAEGTSTITETVFENRFMYVDEFQRMGGQMRAEGNTTTIVGQPRLSGAPVQSTDLRAAAALVLAGLVAEGETCVSNLYFLDRGYENFEVRLAELGARIYRIAVTAEKQEAVTA
ncbi:MAG: UDP-N-acetylglucosamine 1-carboxyvinyltransferase [Candidatus Sericytochromatia bacterium]